MIQGLCFGISWTLLWRQTERIGTVQPGGEKALGRSYYGTLQSLQGLSCKRALFTRMCCDRTKGNGLNMKEKRSTLDTLKKSFTVPVPHHRHRFPREFVEFPFLEEFKARLDGSLSNLVYWKIPHP